MIKLYNSAVFLGRDVHAFCSGCIIQHIEANIDEVPLVESGDGIKCLILECDRQIHYCKLRCLYLKKCLISARIRRLIRRNER